MRRLEMKVDGVGHTRRVMTGSYIAVKQRKASRIPRHDDIVMGGTQMLIDLGEWVLVHAGAGGVGIAACQIAKGAFIRPSIPGIAKDTKLKWCIPSAWM